MLAAEAKPEITTYHDPRYNCALRFAIVTMDPKNSRAIVEVDRDQVPLKWAYLAQKLLRNTTEKPTAQDLTH